MSLYQITHLVGVEAILIVEELRSHVSKRATRLVDDTDGGYDGTDVEVSQLHQHSVIPKDIVILVRCLWSWKQIPPNKYIVTLEVMVDDATAV